LIAIARFAITVSDALPGQLSFQMIKLRYALGVSKG